MDDKLVSQLDKWNRRRQPHKIIKALENLPQEQLDYDLTCQLARAYNNRRQKGDCDLAIALLLSVASKGQEDAIWHFRLGYAYFYSGRYAQALSAFEQTLTRLPNDSDAQYFAKACRKKLSKKSHTEDAQD